MVMTDNDQINADMSSPVMYVVHCIDTEGPMTENIYDTFERLKLIYGIAICLQIEKV